MKRELTFFVTEPIEELTVAAIAEEAGRRGHATRFECRMDAPADIGFYVCHVKEIPEVRSTFSVIMPHDLGQHHVQWPHFWQVEPWDRFDLGLLPGPAWQDMYLQGLAQPGFPGPRLGAYAVGWPKSDRTVARAADFRAEVEAVCQSLRLGPGKNVLYAPSFENDGKQDDFVRACLDLGCNLLIKQAPWPESFPTLIKNIQEMADLHRGRYPHVHLLDSRLDIMTALALADVLVTDESNVMFEALLFGVPSISVQDWFIPFVTPPRPVQAKHAFSILSTRAQLRDHVRLLLEQGYHAPALGKALSLEAYRDRWFSHRGRSAVAILDLLEWMTGPAHALHVQHQAEFNARLADQQRWRSAVERSLSWRMTRPLRALAKPLAARSRTSVKPEPTSDEIGS